MAGDERRSWIDRAMASDGWEPPAGFTARVVARAMTATPERKPQLDLVTRVQSMAMGVVQSMRGRLDGAAWVLLQYRQLFGRS